MKKIETSYSDAYWNNICQATIPAVWRASYAGAKIKYSGYSRTYPIVGYGDTEAAAIADLKARSK